MPVTTSLYGRLGNQLFQVSNCIAYALRHKLDYFIPVTGTNLGSITSYKFPNQEDVTCKVIHAQIGHHYTEIPYYSSVRLHGHFQSEKYFKDYKKEVREILGFPEATIESCAIHVRRGDYLNHPNFPVLPLEFYRESIHSMFSRGVYHFIVCSDDIAWCKEHLSRLFWDYLGLPEVIYMQETAEIEIKCMSACKYQIIANSSFSLFASLINDKTVIAPHINNWYGKGLKHLNLKDLLPDHFEQIKVRELVC